jgi:putative flippase GtrA
MAEASVRRKIVPDVVVAPSSLPMMGDTSETTIHGIVSDGGGGRQGRDDRNKKRDSNTTSFLLRLIRRVESVTVPRWCFHYLRRKQQLQPRSGDEEDSGAVYIVEGLERVFYGTQPAADVVTVLGIHPPRYLCYMLSGFLCDVIQFGIDFALFLRLRDASLCWALSFAVSIVFRHTTHRYLVFGDYVGGYWRSLSRMYAGYSVIIVLSTLFNIFMTKYINLPHAIAWMVTLLWTGIVNYFILKKLWSFGGSSTTSTRNKDKWDSNAMGTRSSDGGHEHLLRPLHVV